MRNLKSDDINDILNKKNIANIDRTYLYVIRKVLEDSKLMASLKGAYSLKVYSILKNKQELIRATSDLDFDVIPIQDLKEYVEEWAISNGFKVLKSKLTKEENLKIRINAPELDSNLKRTGSDVPIDMDFSKNEKPDSGVVSPDKIMTQKLNLKLEIIDRRPKDLIDFMVNLKIYYPEGIKKKDLLDMIEDNDRLRRVASEENMESCLYQVKSFNPQKIGGELVQDHVVNFFTMINGLIDNNVLNDSIFNDGYWYRK